MSDLYSIIFQVGAEIGIEGTIRRYLIGKLAGLLSERLKCSEDPRDVLDWLTAEGFVDASLNIGGFWEYYARNVGSHLRFNGESVYDVVRKYLPDLQIMDWVLGRMAWEGYQRLIYELSCPPYYGEDLPSEYARKLVSSCGREGRSSSCG